jgi:1-deoxy-D-xylulose-5-phosphate synthase
MSISPSVGALSRSLNKLRLNLRYRRAKGEAKGLLRKLHLGFLIQGLWNRLKRGLKGLIMPTTMWEELGFKYIGPINGHNISEMEEALLKAKGYTAKPIFLHILTKKGEGYEPAEKDMAGFHGVSPSGIEGGDALSYSEVFGQTLLRIFQEEPKAVAITAAMLEGTGLDIVSRQFPHRVFDVGICEQHAVTLAAGLASQGFIPIVAIYSTFLQRAYDQIVHDVCLQNLPVVFAVDRAGIVGEDGKTHHGALDLSYLSGIPNMLVAAASDENELQHLLYTAVRAGRPMAIRYPRGRGAGMPLAQELHQLPIGEGEVLRHGDEVAILAVGSMVAPSLKAAELLEENGLQCTVVNARFVKPLDANLILSIGGEVKKMVTVEENALGGGFGSRVSSLLQGSHIKDISMVSIGLPDEFIEHGSQELLRSKLGLDGEGIAHRILNAFPELALHSLTGGKG